MEPESTAARVALWRALHIQLDAPPHVLDDEIGYRLVAPAEGWRERPDMHPQGTSTFRASIVARSRFIEDLLVEKLSEGIAQYVILGAGVDTFAQRKPEIASRLNMFEVDQPAAQEWKKHRLNELVYGTPEWLNFVPVDFESGDDWWRRLVDAGFDVKKTALVASTGVSMYLTRESIESTLRQVARLATGSVFVMSFLLPIEMADAEVRPGLERAVQGARASGTPFISFFQPQEIMDLARECGFSKVEHVSAEELGNRYFAGRPDGLRPPRNTEELLVATT